MTAESAPQYWAMDGDDCAADPWCTECGTDEYLIVEGLEPAVDADPSGRPLWNISYSCSECESFYGHLTRRPLPGLEDSLSRLVADDAGYVHCGEPMQPVEAGLHPIYDPVSNEDPMEGPVLPLVQLETVLLSCACGFRMEVPAEASSEGN
jgi:hypothetical protein